ncbi:MAG: histidinol phosphate phosphatase [Sandaracinaceae bacterium]|nr:histidinol phosphate phosphatase [Sandaracinaceae bacterium]MDW8245813.1 inositol monophosphatase family protein [Sandaracinaceae bacterium]
MGAKFTLERIGGRKALDEIVCEVIASGQAARRLAEEGRAFAQFKEDGSPVTEADRMIESRLRACLSRLVPEANILGEEEGGSFPSEGELSFLIDPIDGTRAFMRGLSTWSILVALLEGKRPVLGVAYLPAEDDLYLAVEGHGAYRNGRPLRVSQISALEEAAISHGALAQFLVDGSESALFEIAGRSASQRGLTDFDGYRRLLAGQLDVVIDPAVAPWDIAAPAILVREAGGRFTDLNGEETIFGRGAIASNGKIHEEVVAIFRRNSEARK